MGLTERIGVSWRPALWLALVFLAPVGCQMVGSHEPPPTPKPGPEAEVESPIPEGGYVGVIAIEGGEVQASLQLSRMGSRGLRGTLDLSSDVRAEGTGEMENSGVRLELSYAGSCPGRMVLVGRWDSGADVLSGIIRASDCTGEAEGSFRFTSAVLQVEVGLRGIHTPEENHGTRWHGDPSIR